MVRKLEDTSKPSAVLKNPCLNSTMKKLFEKRNRTGDIKFMVDGEEIRAHRCVLAALSARYEAQFYGDLAETDTINVTDVSADAFKEFLQFFYTDEVTLTLDNIEDVLNLAKQSLVDELVAECMNFLKNVIGLDKLLWCYQLAIIYDVKPMEKFCMKLIGVNIKRLFESTEFLTCERDVLQHILNLNSLNCKETDVFAACMSWARGKCQQEGLDAADPTNLRAALGVALFKIRFCSMDNEEFATINRNYSGLLTAQESIEVFHAIALKANGVHSDTFGDGNSMARELIQPSFVCLFTNGERIPFNSVTGLCFVDFYTDKVLVLNGFVLCNKINDDIELSYTLGLYGDSIHPHNTKLLSDTETTILFDDPIEIPANERCLIRVDSRAFRPSRSGLFGFNLDNETTQNGVSFHVPYKTEPNLITRLLFDIDD